MLLFEFPDIIKIFYEKENDLIVHEWLEYNPEDQDNTVLIILQKLYDVFLEYPVEKVIVKADRTKGAFSPEIQKYIKDVQVPRLLSDTNVRYIVTVESEDKIKKVGVKLWQGQFNKNEKIILHNVGSEEEARHWLKTIA